jgi:hypothetical protein
MRCGEIAIVGLISHPRYSRRQAWREEGVRMVKRRLEKRFDFWVVELLTREDARSLVKSWVPRLIRMQRPTGMWKVKDAKRVSCGILLALRHAGLLDPLLRRRSLRCDPLAPFARGLDYYDVLVRREFLTDAGEVDRAVARHITESLGLQRADGSWDGTVISTCHHVDRVMRLGLPATDSRLQKAARWLLRHCIDDVRRESSAVGGVIVAHSMFSGEDRASEFKSAVQFRPEWDPKAACFRHLPNIQNGLAIRTLVALGHANDGQVIRACENIVELGRCFGGYCDTNIRKALEASRASVQRP